MLPSIRAFPLLALLSSALAAAPVQAQARDTVFEGMSEVEVVRKLGPPAQVRRMADWTYLFYPNGCPILCGKDDVVFIRGCRVVTAILLRRDRHYAGTQPRTALPAAQPGECAPEVALAAGTAADPEAVPQQGNGAAVVPAAEAAADSLPPGRVRNETGTLVASAGRSEVAGNPALPVPVGRVALQSLRDSLRMPRARTRVLAIPAGSISTPTAFGLQHGEGFVGAGFQHRTRYTDEADGAVVAGIGLGSRSRAVAVELALTSYSTIRGGGPAETGGFSFKVHREIDGRTGVAVGVENALEWGDPDGGRSVYGAVSRVFRLRGGPGPAFSALMVTVGAGSGRFRTEDDVIDQRERVSVFGSAAVRVAEPASVIADWTGQDLNLAVSVTPLRRRPLVVNLGVADITGTAGDGVRFIASVGYGFLLRSPF